MQKENLDLQKDCKRIIVILQKGILILQMEHFDFAEGRSHFLLEEGLDFAEEQGLVLQKNMT